MKELSLPEKLKDTLNEFIIRLKDTYGEELISVVLYGSSASGEFTTRYSNVNLLVILKDTSLDNLNKISTLITRHKFQMIKPLFFSEDYIKRSIDAFPIEFLDMKENHIVLHGKDVLSSLAIDIKNLRFQCEQELKAKLVNIKHAYLRTRNTQELKRLLSSSFTSIIHISRNLVRLKGKNPSYLKEDVLKDISSEFNIDITNFTELLETRKKNLKLKPRETEGLFFILVKDIEKIIDIVDRL